MTQEKKKKKSTYITLLINLTTRNAWGTTDIHALSIECKENDEEKKHTQRAYFEFMKTKRRPCFLKHIFFHFSCDDHFS